MLSLWGAMWGENNVGFLPLIIGLRAWISPPSFHPHVQAVLANTPAKKQKVAALASVAQEPRIGGQPSDEPELAAEAEALALTCWDFKAKLFTAQHSTVVYSKASCLPFPP